MKGIFFALSFGLLLTACQSSVSPPQTGRALVEKSIAFHDPDGVWDKMKATFVFRDSLPPGRESRSYEVSFDNEKNKLNYRKNDLHYLVWEDSVTIFQGQIEEERALRMRNYYQYLWGLPMKLMDPGTVIEDSIQEKTLDGKIYQVVRVPYEKDIWYFYFEPSTARMAAYSFYQDEKIGKGEVIYLDGLLEWNGMKIPQNRTWYRTEIPEFLGTDQLLEIRNQN